MKIHTCFIFWFGGFLLFGFVMAMSIGIASTFINLILTGTPCNFVSEFGYCAKLGLEGTLVFILNTTMAILSIGPGILAGFLICQCHQKMSTGSCYRKFTIGWLFILGMICGICYIQLWGVVVTPDLESHNSSLNKSQYLCSFESSNNFFSDDCFNKGFPITIILGSINTGITIIVVLLHYCCCGHSAETQNLLSESPTDPTSSTEIQFSNELTTTSVQMVPIYQTQVGSVLREP